LVLGHIFRSSFHHLFHPVLSSLALTKNDFRQKCKY
jgi:hypothetical protein